ncbi:hypothetical protein ACJ73_10068, partial [Blastomyces percursus]
QKQFGPSSLNLYTGQMANISAAHTITHAIFTWAMAGTAAHDYTEMRTVVH